MIDLTVNDNPSHYQQQKPYSLGAGVKSQKLMCSGIF